MATKKAKFVVYGGPDEMLVTLLKDEEKMRRRWFKKTMGRDLNEYDRYEVSEDTVQLDMSAHLSVGNRDF
jgi:hypothetical protein